MAKQKHYSLANIYSTESQYNLLLGERSNGKSYQVKHCCVYEFLNKGYMFVYLRRLGVEVKNYMVESYFNDCKVKELSKGKYTLISVFRSEIFLGHIDPETQKVVRDVKCGTVMSLASQGHYKSMSLPEYKNVIFEEFITNDVYLPDETRELQQLISTIARRNQIRVWLIGNTISRLCPYFNEWQLINIPRQKQGTIEIYNMKTEQTNDDGSPVVVKIAVELCENSGNNGSMFFGVVSKSITNGSWETQEQPHIPYPYDECQMMYAVTVIKHNMMYTMELLKHKEHIFIFVHPTKKVKTRRVITEEYTADMYYTSKLVELTSGDKLLRYLIKLNKICYSDNLTGTEFSSNVLPGL